MMQILAVGMIDGDTFGRDLFYVQTGPAEIVPYMAYRDGRLEALGEPGPLELVYAAVEKFNAAYILEEPIALRDLAELTAYLGRFEFTSDTRCRLRHE